MTCDRCHKPINPAGGYDTIAPDSASGAAPTVYLHKRACKSIVRQTVPEADRWRPRRR